jgi:hypothetical protein
MTSPPPFREFALRCLRISVDDLVIVNSAG